MEAVMRKMKHTIAGKMSHEDFATALLMQYGLSIPIRGGKDLPVKVSAVSVNYADDDSFFFVCRPAFSGPEGGMPDVLFGRYSFATHRGVLDPDKDFVTVTSLDAPSRRKKK